MSDEVKCPYCSSKDLTIIPPAYGTTSTSTVYRCSICHRTFSKTPPKSV